MLAKWSHSAVKTNEFDINDNAAIAVLTQPTPQEHQSYTFREAVKQNRGSVTRN